ncbi:MAG: ATP synthase F1 subunit gamma [Halanaerobiaceae bacterium]|jgi:F-type H+-transporting ATPase subunit gamma|nr:ATP synthase F1 subunit gamma [Halanaerobiaceae bacterium]
MESMRDIKRRINSIKNTQKITNAMKMVAAAKLRRSQEMAERARPFFNKTREIIYDVSQYTNDYTEHPLFLDKGGKRHLYIVINSDRGLCGAYNIKAVEKARDSFRPVEEVFLIVIGRHARDFFKKRNFNIVSEYINIPDYPDYRFSKRIADELISLYKEDIVDRVSIVYTHFNSVISQTAKLLPLLPLAALEKPEEKEDKMIDYLYEPSPDAVFDILLPAYINNILYSAILEAKASEYGAVMTAMDSATDNAEELIGELTLIFNRARQSAITTEITEIVGGAEALK